MNLPAIYVQQDRCYEPLARRNPGQRSDVSKYWARTAGGHIDLESLAQIEDGIARSQELA